MGASSKDQIISLLSPQPESRLQSASSCARVHKSPPASTHFFLPSLKLMALMHPSPNCERPQHPEVYWFHPVRLWVEQQRSGWVSATSASCLCPLHPPAVVEPHPRE